MLVKQCHDGHITPSVELCVHNDLVHPNTSYTNETYLSNNFRLDSILYGILSFAIRYMSFILFKCTFRTTRHKSSVLFFSS